MNAYIYCRISKGDSNSIESQINECTEFCDSNGWDVKYVYSHVCSSRNIKNKKLINEIINEMNKGDILVINSVCRFSRNVYGGLQILGDMEKKGLKIYSVSEKVSYDIDNIHDRFRFRQIMNSAELETDVISVRTKRGKRYKIQKNNKRKKIENNKVINDIIDKYNMNNKNKKRKITKK